MIELYFGQQRERNIDFFKEKWLRMSLETCPHYRFLSGDVESYRKYLEYSWKSLHPNVNKRNIKIDEKLSKYKKLVSEITSNGQTNKIEIFQGIDNKWMIHHGNHRASICYYYGIEPKFIKYDLVEYLTIHSKNDELHYGSAHRGMPYQSIFRNGELLVKGRRDDIIERMDLISSEDIVNKKIIDFGSNLGMSAIRSYELGAKEVVGWELSPELVDSAYKIAVALNCPIKYYSKNLSIKNEFTQKFDTAFCFSIHKHINNDINLAHNIHRSGANILYFESHFLEHPPKQIVELFDTCEHIGYTVDSTRKFWKLTKY